MENNNFNKDKFNIYEPLLDDICRLEDRCAGKLVRLIYRYIFYGEEFKNERKDIAEIKFWAKQSDIEKMNREKRTKHNCRHIIFYYFYADYFNLLNDNDAGRLFKKIVDEELKTKYLKNGVFDITTADNYCDIQDMYKRYRSEKIKIKLKEKHDFSKIQAEFTDIDWDDFDPNRYKQINCKKLYEYMLRCKYNEPDEFVRLLSIDEIITFYLTEKEEAINSIECKYDNLNWSGFNLKDKKYQGIDFFELYYYMNENNYNSILKYRQMTIDEVIERFKEYKKKQNK